MGFEKLSWVLGLSASIIVMTGSSGGVWGYVDRLLGSTRSRVVTAKAVGLTATSALNKNRPHFSDGRKCNSYDLVMKTANCLPDVIEVRL